MYEDGLTRANGGKVVGHDHKNEPPNNTGFKPTVFSKLIQTKPNPVISADWCLSSLKKVFVQVLFANRNQDPRALVFAA